MVWHEMQSPELETEPHEADVQTEADFREGNWEEMEGF